MSTSSAITTPSSSARAPATSWQGLSAAVARGTTLVVIGVAAAAGVLATSADASSLAYARAGEDLTRLLQAMALLKAILALGVVAALLWRLARFSMALVGSEPRCVCHGA